MASGWRRLIGGRAPATAATSATAAVGAGLMLQRRHVHRIARDADYLRLSAPLGGRRLSVTSSDGTRLNARMFGDEAGPTVVLAHGWTEQLSVWGPVIERLSARGMRLVAYDLRGHGRSDLAVDHDYSLQRFGEDVEAVLVAANPDRERATVAGHSLGAMSIAAWAEGHDVRAQASAAAMINTGLGDMIIGHVLFGEVAKRLGHPAVSRIFMGSRAPMPSFSSPLQHALVRYVAFGPTATAGQVAFYERMLMACPADVRAACGVAISDMDLWDAVARMTVPTMVLAGENDRLTPPSHARRIAETLPDLAALIELPETGHMSPLERPDELSQALAELVERVSPRVGVAAV